MTAVPATPTGQPVRVLIALGSDTLQAVHIEWASQRLALLLDDLHLSRTCWTADVRGTEHYYMNRLATGTTMLSADALQQALKQLEARTGRTPSAVTLDLDIMQYGSLRCHERDWPRPYIQLLLPDVQHVLP